MADFLTVFFPQWQGAGKTSELYDGALAIRDALLPEGGYEQIDVSLDTGLTAKHGIWAYDAILAQLKQSVERIAGCKPHRIFTIGGGCGVEIAPVSYLNRLYGGDLTVIWFDAHGDLNTPESSPSGYFHGMPLRALLDEGDDGVTGQCFSYLAPVQVVLAGCRELDPGEEEYVYRHDVPVLDGDTAALTDTVRVKGSPNLYIHLDLDVLDPAYFPSVLCPVRGGIAMGSLMKTLRTLQDQFNIVGFSVTEYAPGDGADISRLRDIVGYGYGIR